MKLVIVGGVAGGASAAARARRLDETAEIVLFERGEYISFANCGLPYHIGEVIPERSSLLVMTPEMLKARANIEARVLQEVVSINREAKTVSVRHVKTGETYEESYDRLILSTGSRPLRPDLPGIDDPAVLSLWTIPDMDKIKELVDGGAEKAVVVGGGFIGLEVAENLRERGLDVTLVEMLPQVLPTLDAEMTRPLTEALASNGIDVRLGSRVSAIRRQADASTQVLTVELDGGPALAADLVVMSAGVRPNSELAQAAGLELGVTGGVKVDDHLRTSDEDIYAVGDVIEVTDWVRQVPARIPLAGPANRQGRIAADNIAGRASVYRGSQGTSVVKVFNLTAASTGGNERVLRAAGLEYRKVYLHPASHAGYYPGAAPLAMKLLFGPDGRVLGAQAVGEDGVDKRMDVLATAIRSGLTVYDLEELELSYAPPFGSAKDPVNLAGMLAANVLRGDTRPVCPDELPEGALLLDVREPAERELGHMADSAFIPLGQLRSRLDELPKDQPIVVYCKVGLRGYLAEKILQQNGFDAYNLSGGWMTVKMFSNDPIQSESKSQAQTATCQASAASCCSGEIKIARSVDVRSLQCPGPVVRIKQEIESMVDGEILQVEATQGFAPDLESWCRMTGHNLVDMNRDGGAITARVQKSGTVSVPAVNSGGAPDKASIVLFSGDLDKVMAAFIIATGMAAQGTKVSMFFTFWGLNVLRKDSQPAVKKDLLSRMFGWMMPRGARKLALSKMHMMGMGTGMMKYVMNRKQVPSLSQLIFESRGLGVKFVACEMAMNVMGLQPEELLEYVDETAGVASFAEMSRESGTTLFI